jgi:hypothetical protein
MAKTGFHRASYWILALIVTLVPLFAPLRAQNSGPDYSIRNIRSRFSDDKQQTIIEFEVINIGDAAATASANVTLNVIATGQQVAVQTVKPLQPEQQATVTLTFATSQFASASAENVERFRVAVGVGEIEAQGSANLQDNFAQISITFPAGIVQATLSVPAATPETAPETIAPAASDPISRILAKLGIKSEDSTQVLPLLILVVFVALILLLLLWIILRLIFRRAPDTGNWQSPYVMLPLDPNSPAGRRQQWQQHAQNASLPPSPAEGNVMARKLLAGSDSRYLSGWRAIGIRISQYDMYGRVNRSQTLARTGVVRRLDGTARKRDKLTREQIIKRLRPAARSLIGQFQRKISERTAMLPVVMDVRWQGKAGEVRILFELYQAHYGEWQQVDQWEPDMRGAGKRIGETYTFTAYGQRPGETMRAFRQRLGDDVAILLADMLKPEPNTGPQDTQAHPAAVKL